MSYMYMQLLIQKGIVSTISFPETIAAVSPDVQTTEKGEIMFTWC